MTSPKLSFAIVSTMSGDPWGGSEELWSRAAQHLLEDGHAVSASVFRWPVVPQQLTRLRASGAVLQRRLKYEPFLSRVLRRLLGRGAHWDLERFLVDANPDLVVFSDGGAFAPGPLLQICVRNRLRFACISQANNEQWWPTDQAAAEYRDLMQRSAACYFVSLANMRLAEMQLGTRLCNASVVRNPFNVAYDSQREHPSSPAHQILRLACIGRLHPPSKGQDLLIEALGSPEWRDRDWHLTLYGSGPMQNGLSSLTERFGIRQRVTFAGFVNDVESIWKSNDALVLTSRIEGLPLAIVEAMLCGRPVLATDVAGNAELVVEGETGFLADSPTVRSVSSALERLWHARGDLVSLGTRAAIKARALYGPDPAADFARELVALASAPRRDDEVIEPRSAGG